MHDVMDCVRRETNPFIEAQNQQFPLLADVMPAEEIGVHLPEGTPSPRPPSRRSKRSPAGVTCLGDISSLMQVSPARASHRMSSPVACREAERAIIRCVNGDTSCKDERKGGRNVPFSLTYSYITHRCERSEHAGRRITWENCPGAEKSASFRYGNRPSTPLTIPIGMVWGKKKCLLVPFFLQHRKARLPKLCTSRSKGRGRRKRLVSQASPQTADRRKKSFIPILIHPTASARRHELAEVSKVEEGEKRK